MNEKVIQTSSDPWEKQPVNDITLSWLYTPHNIFLSFDGRVILGDFGVALIQAYGDASPGEVLGKLGYLAPEMVTMEEVDRRADLFSNPRTHSCSWNKFGYYKE